MAGPVSPLSSTVSSIFDAFIKKLGDEKVLDTAGLEALTDSLGKQKLDPATLRKAMFTVAEKSDCEK